VTAQRSFPEAMMSSSLSAFAGKVASATNPRVASAVFSLI